MQRSAFVVSVLGTYASAVGDGAYKKKVNYSLGGDNWTGLCETGNE